jgi:DNA-binding beta-propeller fold protein YncE
MRNLVLSNTYWLTVALAAGVAACSGFDSAEASDMAQGAPDEMGSGGAQGGTGTSTEPPPEQELESSFGAPVATGRYVWVANPTSGRVAYIDAKTLSITVVEAGNAPTFLAPVPSEGDDVAIVLNVLSRDATVLRAKGSGLSSLSLPVPSSGNTWAISKSGRWATAWTDARQLASADPIDGYQDLTVLDLATGAERSTPLTVGYRPVAVAYDASEARMFAVTQDGISVIALDAAMPSVVKNVALSSDPTDDTTTRDVAITPDGKLALVRRDGATTVTAISLSSGERIAVPLPGPATDLDLSVDGKLAVAVIRSTSQVALLPIPSVMAAPEDVTIFSVPNATVGSVVLASESPLGLLYTNATPSSLLTVFDSSAVAPEPRTLKLRAPVQAVFPTADAAHAVVLHGALELDSGSKYAAALSLVPIASSLPSKILGLDAPAVSVALSPAGDHALVATGDSQRGLYRLVVAELPSQKIDVHPLASEPIAAGIVAGAKRGFVAQKHRDGRITFVDFETGGLQTLTGFELASQVVNGSKP